MSVGAAGFFGKLPTHGDFISRDLPAHFIDIWDNWLQLFVSTTQGQLGEEWLDIYLTSPIWRFVFSEGVVDEQVWAGVMLPSVDKVGRYFPFSIVAPLAGSANGLELLTENQAWFEEIEDIALQALEGQYDLDSLLDAINEVADCQCSAYEKDPSVLGGGAPTSPLLVRTASSTQGLQAAMPALLDAALKNSYASYSAWATLGSDYVEPCIFVARGLPTTSGASSLLEGRWDEWGWPEPYLFLTQPDQPEDSENE
ncbi:type VI secretion system-associated protein TagF [Teredinibacter turnerae]|uniref:type VI secretion system-associated protein TagF n=1 Tax=Teredinibacter turnerae TaxID=2426 RepID=UPI0003FAF0EA|nr:type VI secretion system-associated protein TagF [Teredinibacter turnerae]